MRILVRTCAGVNHTEAAPKVDTWTLIGTHIQHERRHSMSNNKKEGWLAPLVGTAALLCPLLAFSFFGVVPTWHFIASVSEEGVELLTPQPLMQAPIDR